MIEEISIQELAKQEPDSYLLIDMRDSSAFALGHIDGAVNLPQQMLQEQAETLPQDKMLVLCCRSGIISEEAAASLREKGLFAVNLIGGYVQ